jgi:integrase
MSFGLGTDCELRPRSRTTSFTSIPGERLTGRPRLRLFNPEEPAMNEFGVRLVRRPWNRGKLVGQKTPLKLKEIWAIRVRLQVFGRMRELALFDLGIDSKLRACDLLKLKVRDVRHGERVAARAIVVQQKTSRPVQFEITEPTRTALADWIRLSGLASDDFLFPSRVRVSPHLSTRQYARIVVTSVSR